MRVCCQLKATKTTTPTKQNIQANNERHVVQCTLHKVHHIWTQTCIMYGRIRERCTILFGQNATLRPISLYTTNNIIPITKEVQTILILSHIEVQCTMECIQKYTALGNKHIKNGWFYLLFQHTFPISYTKKTRIFSKCFGKSSTFLHIFDCPTVNNINNIIISIKSKEKELG